MLGAFLLIAHAMNRITLKLPVLFTLLCIGLSLWHGPILQPERYHDFADQRTLFGLKNAADVLSNTGFAIVGIWGLCRLWPVRKHSALSTGWPGYRLFLIALILTAIGSGFYHLFPDNARLLWDRLPIALACAGLLAGVRAETQQQTNAAVMTNCLALFAAGSVGWWYISGESGYGDLRPYLLLQFLPLILIPLWQWIYQAPRKDRIAFNLALILYVTAKLAELQDAYLFTLFSAVSGHTLKHLLATAAVAVITARLSSRAGAAPKATQPSNPCSNQAHVNAPI